MINITQTELEQLVGEDAGGIGKAKERVIREYGSNAHGSGVQSGFPAEVA